MQGDTIQATPNTPSFEIVRERRSKGSSPMKL